MSYLRARRLPINPTPAAQRPMASHFPVSQDQLSQFVRAHQADEKRRAVERENPPEPRLIYNPREE